MRRAKITIIGAGNVGASCAVWAAQKELGDIVLIDIPDFGDKTAGKALDLAQCAPVLRFDCNIVGTSDYSQAEGSDVVIITAGIPRKPGMSRDDLIQTNVKIVGSVSEQIARVAPQAVLIVVSNPSMPWSTPRGARRTFPPAAWWVRPAASTSPASALSSLWKSVAAWRTSPPC